MKVLSSNVRSLGKSARRGLVKNYIYKEKIDIVGLQP
jgi:exonuclease III